MLDFTCQRCRTTYHAEESHVGKMIRCRQCGDLVAVTGPARQVETCKYCGKPMDAPQGHVLCAVIVGQQRNSIVRSPRWLITRCVQYVKTHVVFVAFALIVIAIIGMLVNPFNLFRRANIRPGVSGGSSSTSGAVSAPPRVDSQPSPPAASAACDIGIGDSRASSGLPNGTEILRPRRLSGYGKLEVDNGNPTDAVVYLVDLDTKKLVRRFYVEANNRFTESRVAPGVYQVYFVTGRDWNSETRSFNRCAESYRFDKDLEFSEQKDQATEEVLFNHHTITLHRVVGGTVPITPIDMQSFNEMMAQSE